MLPIIISLIASLFGTPTLVANKAIKAPIIDGKANDACWKKAAWLPIDQVWLGKPMSKGDFKGRYKLSWDSKFLYVLAEIEDDTLIDIHPDGLDKYWDDDCLEIFIDADASGGDHLASYNAWAYHTALDGKTTDFGPDGKPHYYNDHVINKRITKGNKTVWECAYAIYPDTYVDGQKNTPLILKKGQKLGFAIAYCDNDRSPERENFIGNVSVAGEDKNQGYKTADIFAKLELK